MIRVTVKYFAALRDQAGRMGETREIVPQTVRDLYQLLCTDYGFDIPPRFVKFAVNAEFVDAATTLQDGDEIVFVPPVSGG